MNIMKFKPLFLIISFFLIVSSLLAIIFWGFNSSIDFTGGAAWEIVLPSKPQESVIQDIFNQNKVSNLTIVTNEDKYLLEFQDITSEQKIILDKAISKIDIDFFELKFETIGPSLGRELFQKTIVAIILSCSALLLFISYRFKDFHFGVSAIIALIHDSVVLIGSFSILGYFFGAELNSLFVTALLTTLSLSVYDTVVIFDRIRELRSQNYKLEWTEIVNKSVVESLTRSINTSATTIFTLTALVLLGGETTKWFSTALLIGITCGTYSSIGVALPLVLFFKRNRKKN